jgi:hypothetical protein
MLQVSYRLDGEYFGIFLYSWDESIENFTYEGRDRGCF